MLRTFFGAPTLVEPGSNEVVETAPQRPQESSESLRGGTFSIFTSVWLPFQEFPTVWLQALH